MNPQTRAEEIVKKILAELGYEPWSSSSWIKLIQNAIDAETEELRERLRLSQANLIHWDVFVDKERVVKGTFVADDKPQLNIGTIKERLPTKETAEEFQRMRDAATPNLGDDCPIKPPTLEQAWQWHLEEANKKGFSTSSLTDITIPDWFRREYEEKYQKDAAGIRS